MKSSILLNNIRHLRWFKYSLILLSICFIYGCGSVISASTVKLSADVGKRITEMEHLHQLAIQRYFDLEQQKIEDFLVNTWEPLFLKNFLGTSQVLDKLQNISYVDETNQKQMQTAMASYLTDPSEAKKLTDELISDINTSREKEGADIRTIITKYVEDDQIDAAVIHVTSLLQTDEPARIIFDFAEAAHAEMNDRKASLLAPLNQLRTETSAQLSAAYAELIRGQSTITGRLEASAKVSQQQDQLLGALGIKTTTTDIQSKLSSFTNKVDGALGLAGGLTAADGNGTINLPDNILKTLEAELKSLNSTPDSN